MKKINNYLFSFIITLLIIFANILPSCKKDKPPTCTQIFVENKNGGAISGARVRLHQDSYIPDSTVTNVGDKDTNLYKIDFTDADGRVEFCYEMEAIWEIAASKDGMKKDDFVKLVDGETVTKIITLK